MRTFSFRRPASTTRAAAFSRSFIRNGEVTSRRVPERKSLAPRGSVIPRFTRTLADGSERPVASRISRTCRSSGVRNTHPLSNRVLTPRSLVPRPRLRSRRPGGRGGRSFSHLGDLLPPPGRHDRAGYEHGGVGTD